MGRAWIFTIQNPRYHPHWKSNPAWFPSLCAYNGATVYP